MASTTNQESCSWDTNVHQREAHIYSSYLESMVVTKDQLIFQTNHNNQALAIENEQLRKDVDTKAKTIDDMQCDLYNVTVAKDEAYKACRLKTTVEDLVAFILDDSRTKGGLRDRIEGIMKENTTSKAMIEKLKVDIKDITEKLQEEKKRVQTLKDTIFYLQDKVYNGQRAASEPLKEIDGQITGRRSSAIEAPTSKSPFPADAD